MFPFRDRLFYDATHKMARSECRGGKNLAKCCESHKCGLITQAQRPVYCGKRGLSSGRAKNPPSRLKATGVPSQ